MALLQRLLDERSRIARLRTLQGGVADARSALDPAAAARELQQRFSLTPRQAALAIALLETSSLTAAARALNIGRETGRTHLRAVLAATGTRTQADLVCLLVRIFVNTVNG